MSDSKERLSMIYEAMVMKRFLKTKFVKNMKPKRGYLIYVENDTGDYDEDVGLVQDEWEGRMTVLKKEINKSTQNIEKYIKKEMKAYHENLNQFIIERLRDTDYKIARIEKKLENKPGILDPLGEAIDYIGTKTTTLFPPAGPSSRR